MLRQILNFAIVGLVAAIVDVGGLILLKEILCVDVLVASAVSFSVSVTVNYICSMKFVFRSKNQSKIKEFLLFVLLSIGGLCLNQLILWVGIDCLSMYYLVVKFLAMVIVPIYNFITRKLFLEAKD